MSTAVAFDTYAYVKKLKQVGVPEAQAEVQVEALAALIADRMATRRDLADVEAALKRDHKELTGKIELRIKELDTRIKELDNRIKGLDVRITEFEGKVDTRIKELDARIKGLDVRITEFEGKVEIRFKELEAQIKELDTRLTWSVKEMDTKLKELELRLVIRLGTLGVIGIGVLAALIKIL